MLIILLASLWHNVYQRDTYTWTSYQNAVIVMRTVVFNRYFLTSSSLSVSHNLVADGTFWDQALHQPTVSPVSSLLPWQALCQTFSSTKSSGKCH